MLKNLKSYLSDYFILIKISTFLAVFFALLFYIVHYDSSLGKWIYGDWVINYSAGFVRRGLSGEIILFISTLFNLSPPTITSLIKIFFLFFSFIYFYKKTNNYTVFLILFSPILLGFYIFDPTATGRKEILLFGIYAIYLLIEKPSILIEIFYIFILSIFLFIYEGLVFFYFFPILSIFLNNLEKNRNEYYKTYITTILLSFPIIISFIIIYKFNPVPFLSQPEICKSLGEWQPIDCTTTGAINGLGDEMPGIQIPYIRQFFFYWTIVILSLVILPKFSKIKYINILPNLKINFYYLFIIGFLISFILSYYAFDWGRWIAINNVCFFMFLLSFQKQKTNDLSIFTNNKLFYLSILPFLFRMPQCCIRPYEDYFLITYILVKFYKLKEIIILYI